MGGFLPFQLLDGPYPLMVKAKIPKARGIMKSNLTKASVKRIVGELPCGDQLSPASRESLESGLSLLFNVYAAVTAGTRRTNPKTVLPKIERAVSLANRLVVQLPPVVSAVIHEDARLRGKDMPPFPEADGPLARVLDHVRLTALHLNPKYCRESFDRYRDLKAGLDWLIETGDSAVRTLSVIKSENHLKYDPRCEFVLGLAILYEEVSGLPPTSTRRKGWLSFLAAVMSEAQIESMEIEGAHSLWIRIRKTSRFKKWQKLKKLKTAAT